MEEEKIYKGRGKKFGDFPIKERKKGSPYKMPLAIGIMMAVSALASMGMGYSQMRQGSKARKRAQILDKELENQQDAMSKFDFRVQNPYEDIDVTTKAQKVAQDAQTQQARDILGTLAPTASMGSTAALATSIAKQGSAQASKLAGKMSQAEFKLQQQAAKAQLAIDQSVKQQEFNRDAAIMNMQMYRAAGEYGAAAALSQQGMEAMSTGVQGLGEAAGVIEGAVDTKTDPGTGKPQDLMLKDAERDALNFDQGGGEGITMRNVENDIYNPYEDLDTDFSFQSS